MDTAVIESITDAANQIFEIRPNVNTVAIKGNRYVIVYREPPPRNVANVPWNNSHGGIPPPFDPLRIPPLTVESDGLFGSQRPTFSLVPIQNLYPNSPTFGETHSFDLTNTLNQSFNSYQPRNHPVPQAIIDRIPIQTVDEKSSLVLSSNKEPTTCQICFDIYKTGDKRMFLPCFHHYHKDCVCKWFESHDTCPVCQRKVY